jgi:class 3 adenylate cyclase
MAVPPTTERKIVTVLFCDLEGFTALSEELDPEDVVTIQDAYFTAVDETVRRYGGRLEKYIGDAAVAVFGVPRLRDDDAERAVGAGLALASAADQGEGEAELVAEAQAIERALRLAGPAL